MKLKMLTRIVLILAAWSPLCSVAQIGPTNVIATVAGAAWTFPGDGKLALNAPISQVDAFHTDLNGNIIFADPGNQVVSRLNADGTITVLAGNGVRGFSGDGGPARSASLNEPIDAVMDKDGNLYISDSFNNRIRRVTPGGVISSYVINTVDNVLLAVDNIGTLYFTAPSICRIRKVTAAGVTTFAGNGTCGHSGTAAPRSRPASSPWAVWHSMPQAIFIWPRACTFDESLWTEQSARLREPAP